MDLYMTLAGMSTQMSQAKVMNSINASVASMTLSQMDEQAASLQKLMEASVNPSVGANIDISV